MGAAVRSRPDQLGSMMRTMSRQLKDILVGVPCVPIIPTPRVAVVEKVSHNALAELVGRAKSHPQQGELYSANPAYVALAELARENNLPDLALGLRHETGEITFLDFTFDADKIARQGDAFVERRENFSLWRRLKELIYYKVDRTMVGPCKPIRAPEEVIYED